MQRYKIDYIKNGYHGNPGYENQYREKYENTYTSFYTLTSFFEEKPLDLEKILLALKLKANFCHWQWLDIYSASLNILQDEKMSKNNQEMALELIVLGLQNKLFYRDNISKILLSKPKIDPFLMVKVEAIFLAHELEKFKPSNRYPNFFIKTYYVDWYDRIVICEAFNKLTLLNKNFTSSSIKIFGSIKDELLLKASVSSQRPGKLFYLLQNLKSKGVIFNEDLYSKPFESKDNFGVNLF